MKENSQFQEKELWELHDLWYRFLLLFVTIRSTSSFVSVNGGVAQVVEQRTHKPRAGGSRPSTATTFPLTSIILID